MQVDGQIAIITGGASGLGEGTARELASAGAKVVIWDIQEDKGMAVASDINGVFVNAMSPRKTASARRLVRPRKP